MNLKRAGLHEPLQLRRREDRRRQPHQRIVAGRPFGEPCRGGAEVRRERHHEPLTQRVDGRIGHLGKALAEVVVEQSRTVGQHGRGRVIAHREDRILSLFGHRPQDVRHVLERVAEGMLQRGRLAGRAAILRHLVTDGYNT